MNVLVLIDIDRLIAENSPLPSISTAIPGDAVIEVAGALNLKSLARFRTVPDVLSHNARLAGAIFGRPASWQPDYNSIAPTLAVPQAADRALLAHLETAGDGCPSRIDTVILLSDDTELTDQIRSTLRRAPRSVGVIKLWHRANYRRSPSPRSQLNGIDIARLPSNHIVKSRGEAAWARANAEISLLSPADHSTRTVCQSAHRRPGLLSQIGVTWPDGHAGPPVVRGPHRLARAVGSASWTIDDCSPGDGLEVNVAPKDSRLTTARHRPATIGPGTRRLVDEDGTERTCYANLSDPILDALPSITAHGGLVDVEATLKSFLKTGRPGPRIEVPVRLRIQPGGPSNQNAPSARFISDHPHGWFFLPRMTPRAHQALDVRVPVDPSAHARRAVEAYLSPMRHRRLIGVGAVSAIKEIQVTVPRQVWRNRHLVCHVEQGLPMFIYVTASPVPGTRLLLKRIQDVPPSHVPAELLFAPVLVPVDG